MRTVKRILNRVRSILGDQGVRTAFSRFVTAFLVASLMAYAGPGSSSSANIPYAASEPETCETPFTVPNVEWRRYDIVIRNDDPRGPDPSS